MTRARRAVVVAALLLLALSFTHHAADDNAWTDTWCESHQWQEEP